MRTLTKCWPVSTCVVGLFLASAVLAGDAGCDSRGPSPVGLSGAAYQAGDTIEIAAQDARLMLGTQVIAAVPKGQRIVVLETRGNWVGAQVSAAGQMKAGWIRATDFAPGSRLAGPSRGVGATFAADPQASSQPEASPQPRAYDVGGPVVRWPGGAYSGGTYFGYPVNRYEVYGHYHP
jgi:hypothetical protein